MTVRMAEFGVSFATRERAREIAGLIGSGRDVTIDFTDVGAASPSFVDELVGALAECFSGVVEFCSLSPALSALIDRQIAKREVGDRFHVLALV